MTEVFEFVYTTCIYESAKATISLHKTKRGAYKAMNKHLNMLFNEARSEHLMYCKDLGFDHVFTHEAWGVKTTELQE